MSSCVVAVCQYLWKLLKCHIYLSYYYRLNYNFTTTLQCPRLTLLPPHTPLQHTSVHGSHSCHHTHHYNTGVHVSHSCHHTHHYNTLVSTAHTPATTHTTTTLVSTSHTPATTHTTTTHQCPRLTLHGSHPSKWDASLYMPTHVFQLSHASLAVSTRPVATEQ